MTDRSNAAQSIRAAQIAPCGMNCSLCHAYMRQKNICPGCRGEDALKMKSCAACRIKNCQALKSGEFKYCFECSQYPCALIKHIDKRYRSKYAMSMIANLENIQQNGIRKFVRQEQEKWVCANCGRVICVHKERCLFCGDDWRTSLPAAERIPAQAAGTVERSTASMLGLENGTVRLMPYTPEWQRLFEEEKTRLQAALGTQVLDIQHVGSTSIPGMPAKPILDIAIAVRNYEQAFACIPPIEALGYEHRGEFGIPRRHYFTKGEPRTHHIHMTEITSRDWTGQIAFRDSLRQDAALATEYANLKGALARSFPNDRDAYLEGKAEFIQRVLKLAGIADQE